MARQISRRSKPTVQKARRAKRESRFSNEDQPRVSDSDESLENSKVIEFTPKNEKQRAYEKAITNNTLTFGLGPAGTGKTYVAAFLAAKMFLEKRKKSATKLTAKIICCRPAIEACDEHLGFLPGEEEDKIDPWFLPIKDVLERALGKTTVEYALKKGQIMFVPFAYMRGRTFDNAIILLDEAQNTTPAQMRLFLTRVGENSKVIVDGDLQQMDIKGKSGLEDAMRVLEGKPDVGRVEFGVEDIVRSGFCKMVLAAYRGG